MNFMIYIFWWNKLLNVNNLACSSGPKIGAEGDAAPCSLSLHPLIDISVNSWWWCEKVGKVECWVRESSQFVENA